VDRTLELYSDSPFLQAWNGQSVATNSMAPYHSSGNPKGYWEPSQIYIVVKPLSEKRLEAASERFVNAAIVYRHNNENHGHVMGDEIWPTFQLLHTFEAEKDPFQLVFIGSPINHGGSKIYYEISSQDFPPISNIGTHCFSHVFFGAAGTSYSEGLPFGRAMKEYRDFLWRQSNITAPPLRRLPRILIILKNLTSASTNSAIINLSEAVQAVRSEYPHLTVTSLSWQGMAFRDQVRTMTEHDIVFSLPGNDLMNSLFLPTGSTIVVPCRYASLGIEQSNEVRIWFKVMPHLHCIEICGGQTDMAYNVFENGQRAEHVLNLESFSSYFTQAVRSWFTRRDLLINKQRRQQQQQLLQGG